MQELVQQISDNPGASLAIIGNLIIIESLLSLDRLKFKLAHFIGSYKQRNNVYFTENRK